MDIDPNSVFFMILPKANFQKKSKMWNFMNILLRFHNLRQIFFKLCSRDCAEFHVELMFFTIYTCDNLSSVNSGQILINDLSSKSCTCMNSGPLKYFLFWKLWFNVFHFQGNNVFCSWMNDGWSSRIFYQRNINLHLLGHGNFVYITFINLLHLGVSWLKYF